MREEVGLVRGAQIPQKSRYFSAPFLGPIFAAGTVLAI